MQQTARSTKPLRTFVLCALAAISSIVYVTSVAGNSDDLSTEERRARLFLSRATYGPRPGDLEALLKMGADVWIEQQLQPEEIQDEAADRRVAGFTELELTTAELMQKYPRPTREEREAMQKAREEMQKAQAEGHQDDMGTMRRRMGDNAPRRLLNQLSEAKLQRAIYSDRQLQEVMVDFWFNHFNIYARKNANTVLSLTSYERDAIRPHALGNFKDLLLATAHHPAMLYYLDNWMNMKDGFNPRAEIQARIRETMGQGRGARRGRGGQQRGGEQQQRQRTFGINENYGRELLELHTLGVDGGYTQQDVVETARALTGWSVGNPQIEGIRDRFKQRFPHTQLPNWLADRGQVGAFYFNNAAHDEGPKTILGNIIDQGGINDGLAVLDILSNHPSTARFISTKIAQRFVSDTPSDDLINEMVHSFQNTDGDIRAVLRTMFQSPRFVEEAWTATKVKTPLELVVSSIRATGVETRGPGLARTLNELGMPLYMCQPPTGYDEAASTWLSAGNLLTRIRFTGQLLSGSLRGTSAPGMPRNVDEWADQVLLKPATAFSAADRATLEEALADFPDLFSSDSLSLALILTSPGFQRQ